MGTSMGQNTIQLLSFFPLLLPSPLVFNLSQHQGIIQRVGSLHQMAKLLFILFYLFFALFFNLFILIGG